jgi:hypothetical protein
VQSNCIGWKLDDLYRRLFVFLSSAVLGGMCGFSAAVIFKS